MQTWQSRSILDTLAIEAALRTHRRAHAIKNSFITGTVTELLFKTFTDYTPIASFTTETSLLSGARQPAIPAGFFDNSNSPGRGIRIEARGVLGTTGTPSYTFQVRLGSTSAPTFITGTSVGVSAAIVTQSGVTNVYWELFLNLFCSVPGIGSGNATLTGAGLVVSPAGFASPFAYPLEPTTPNTATWTSTFDDSVNQYVNLTVTSTASNASNTLTLKQLLVYGLN